MNENHFLKGPIYLKEIAEAAKLKGTAQTLHLLIKYRMDLTGKAFATLPKHLLTSCGISASVLSRTLDKMEKAGFIRTQRQKGRSTRIELLKDRK